MVSNSVVATADQIDHGHVPEMHDTKCQCDLAGHGTNAPDEFCPGVNGLPRSDRQRGIPQIKEVITYQQDIVNGIGQFFITM